MKRILFFINTLSDGGAEKVLVDLVNNLDNKKFDITVQTINDVGIHKNNLHSYIHYKTIIKNNFLRKICNYFFLKWVPSKILYKKYVNNNYDIEVAFLEGMPTKIIAESDNPNKYAWVHTDLYNYYGQNSIFKSIQKNADCYKKFKKVICVSHSAKDGFKKRFGFDANVEVVYNPVDDEAIRRKADAPITEIKISDKIKLIAVGRLVYEKGYDRLIRIHKKLLDEGFNAELWILGEGTERTKIERFIIDNKLSDSVKLMGFCDNPYKFMKAADLFVCSSRVEGYSTVVMEAIVLGKSVIVSDCSGMREILGESEYGVVTENNIESLYNGIKNMLSDKKRREYYAKQAEKRSKDFRKFIRVKKIEELFI